MPRTLEQQRTIISRTAAAFAALGEAGDFSKLLFNSTDKKTFAQYVQEKSTELTDEHVHSFAVDFGNGKNYRIDAQKRADGSVKVDLFSLDTEGGARKLNGEYPLILSKNGNKYYFSCDIAEGVPDAVKAAVFGDAGFSQRIGSDSGYSLRPNQTTALLDYVHSITPQEAGIGSKTFNDPALFLMGTGTGKTIAQAALVVSTLGQAGGGAIVVVPSSDLVDGAMGDFRNFVQPKDSSKLVPYSTPQGLNGNLPAINPDNATIMTADQLRAYIAASKREPHRYPPLTGRNIYIDEVHQWTYDKHHCDMLKELKAANRMVGMTATPTGALQEVFGDPICNISLHDVMSQKGIRWIREDVSRVPADANDDVQVKDAVQHYYSTFHVLNSDDKGFVDVETEARGLTTEESKLALVRKAIAVNVCCTWDQKNMLFSSDPERLNKASMEYNRILDPEEKDEFLRGSKGTALIEGLTAEIRNTYEKAGLHPSDADIKAEVDKLLASNKYLSPLEQDRIFMDQVEKSVEHIARGVLAANGDPKKIEQSEKVAVAYMERGTYPAVSRDVTILSVKQIEEFLKSEYKGLSEQELNSLANIVHHKAMLIGSGDLSTKVINAENMAMIGAQNTVVLEKTTREDYLIPSDVYGGISQFDHELNIAKSKLRLGLCHHVMNNQGMVTGISIADVTSSQHLFTGDYVHDPLNNAQDVAQAYGRAIRTTGKVAHEFVSAPHGVQILNPQSMTSKDANDFFMTFQARQANEIMQNAKYFADQLIELITTLQGEGVSPRNIDIAADQYIKKSIMTPLLKCHDWNKAKAMSDFSKLIGQVDEVMKVHSEPSVKECIGKFHMRTEFRKELKQAFINFKAARAFAEEGSPIESASAKKPLVRESASAKKPLVRESARKRKPSGRGRR